MCFAFFIAFILFWRCAKCNNIDFDIYIESLSEHDEYEQVLSNTYTQFTRQDWINQTLFQPVLSNNASLRMHLILIPQEQELQYTINIKHWPWDNINNSIELCFYIIIPNTNVLQFKSRNKVWLEMDHNNIDICHNFYYNDLYNIAYIFYNSETVINRDNITIYPNQNGEILSSQHDNEHHLWLFGVSLAIGVIVCIFVLLIFYLIKNGFFADAPKRHIKRKKSAVIIGMGKHRSSTNSLHTNSTTTSTPPSPKKNLRINVTYHSPTQQNPCKVQSLVRHNKKRSKSSLEVSKSCETRIIDALIEGNEEEENDDELQNLAKEISILTPTVHSRNDTDMESMIQYIITASGDNNRDDSPRPVPFI